MSRTVRVFTNTQATRLRPINKLFIVLAISAVALLGFAQPVGAAAPTRGSFDFTDTFTDSEVCAAWGFDVFVPVEHEYGFYEVFFDNEGNFVKTIVHFNYDATITANGNTINERDTWTTTFYANGSRTAGLTVHIQGPGGIVQLDAGQIVRDADGNVVYTHGPHPQLNGETFCPALAP